MRCLKLMKFIYRRWLREMTKPPADLEGWHIK